jgi:hypothetical protein
MRDSFGVDMMPGNEAATYLRLLRALLAPRSSREVAASTRLDGPQLAAAGRPG